MMTLDSMNGRPSSTHNPGLYVCAAKDIFGILADRHPNLSVCVSFYEIYGYGDVTHFDRGTAFGLPSDKLSVLC